MKSGYIRHFRRNASVSRESSLSRQESHHETAFFGASHHEPFFNSGRGFGQGQFIQPKCTECEKEEKQVQRMPEKKEDDRMLQKAGDEKEMMSTPTFSQKEYPMQNTRHFANCEGVTVEGHTDANYGHSFTAPGSSTPARDCEGCADDCVTNTGTVVSVFTTNPQITLPSVPSGLNKCEQQAVRNFINTTLRAHEQQHVAAFNTYRGTVRTPYTYHGCASGLDAHTQEIHDNLESSRRAAADSQSAALDVNGANIFSITCDCPDPQPTPGP